MKSLADLILENRTEHSPIMVQVAEEEAEKVRIRKELQMFNMTEALGNLLAQLNDARDELPAMSENGATAASLDRAIELAGEIKAQFRELED